MKKILVVDDDMDLLVSVKSFLTRNNFTVSTTSSCSEGLAVFYKFQPNLVILDISVGDEDGREMCKKIKAKAESKHIPVILFSADHDALSAYATHGADGAIEKPFDIFKMLNLIKELLSN